MRIRKSNPKARKSFRARHNCANPDRRHLQDIGLAVSGNLKLK